MIAMSQLEFRVLTEAFVKLWVISKGLVRNWKSKSRADCACGSKVHLHDSLRDVSRVR
jgi:hypothetical protein